MNAYCLPDSFLYTSLFIEETID